MTAPATNHSESTIEDMEAGLEAQKAASKPTDLKLDGEGIPDEFKGKTVADLIAMQDQLKRSLILSEQARASAIAPAPQAPPAPVVEEPKELTDEELTELHSQDPVKAIRIMQEQAVRIAQRNLEARVGPLMSGTTSAVETAARQ